MLTSRLLRHSRERPVTVNEMAMLLKVIMNKGRCVCQCLWTAEEEMTHPNYINTIDNNILFFKHTNQT